MSDVPEVVLTTKEQFMTTLSNSELAPYWC
jgi:hypothetical protein